MHNSLRQIQQIGKKYSVFVVLILFTFLAAAISRCNINDPTKFVFVQLAFIFMPGYALQRLSGLSYQNSLVRKLVSYATGYSLSIIVYLAMLMVGLQQYIIYVYSAICLLSGGYLYLSKQRACDLEIEQKERLYFAYILLATLCVSMVLFQFANLNPVLKQGNTSINQDLVFWMRNAVAATKGYPLPELSVAGKVFFYHYFTSIHIAFLRFTTGIEIYDLSFVYSYLITVLLTVSGLYVAYKELFSSYKIVFVAMCFVLFTKNLDLITDIFFNDHVLKASFGFAEGMGLLFFTIYFYFRMMRREGNQWVLLIMAMLLFFACTGLKGPLAAVLLAGIAAGCFIMVFFRNRFLYGATSGVVLLVVFLIVLGFFVIDIHGEEAVGNHVGLTLSAVDTIFHSHSFEKIYLMMTELGLWKSVSYVVILVMYLVSALLIPFLVFVVTYKKRKVTDEDVVLIVMILTGIALGIIVSQDGMSQMYFLSITIPLIFMYSLVRINEKEISHVTNKRIKVIFSLGLLLFSFQYYGSVISSTYSLVKSNSTLMVATKKNKPSKECKETGLTINESEIIGLRWLKDNSPSCSIVLSNKVLTSEMGSRSFWVSSLSERQAYFESYDYSDVSKDVIRKNCLLINSFYKGDLDAFHKIKDQGVTHAVIFKDIKPNSYPEGCRIIYENDKIIIAQL